MPLHPKGCWPLVQVYNTGVWAALGLMGLSALCAGATDLSFNLAGYLWQLLNCALAAAYSLHLRGVLFPSHSAQHPPWFQLCAQVAKLAQLRPGRLPVAAAHLRSCSCMLPALARCVALNCLGALGR